MGYFIFQMGSANDCCRIVVAVIFFAARMGLLGWSLLFLPLGFILIPALIINLISMCMLCGMKGKDGCVTHCNGRQLTKKERKRCCARAFYITQGIVLTILILAAAFAENVDCMLPGFGYNSSCWNE